MLINRKVKLIGALLAFIIICLACFTACDFFNNLIGKDDEDDGKEYTIMYSDGEEVYTLTVKNGELYSISKPLPYKEGYEFSGLFDAETGGTRYVNSTGISVAPFTDKKHMVLYPQFTPLEYTIEFDLGGETSNNSTLPVRVHYDENLPQLPAELTVIGKDYLIFTGWFAETKDGNTVKISGADGISARKLDAALAALCDSNRVLRLKAVFRIAQ